MQVQKTAWWFQTWLLFSRYMGCHPEPIDEVHHFSRWLLHHQPDENRFLGPPGLTHESLNTYLDDRTWGSLRLSGQSPDKVLAAVFCGPNLPISPCAGYVVDHGRSLCKTGLSMPLTPSNRTSQKILDNCPFTRSFDKLNLYLSMTMNLKTYNIYI